MKMPDRRITVLAYTMLSIWLLIYTYGCLATHSVAVQSPAAVFSPAATTDALADIPDDNQWVAASSGLRTAGLFSRLVRLEKKDAGVEKRFRVVAR